MSVIGFALGSFMIFLKSQTQKHPSSAPLAIKLFEKVFHEMTLTSVS